MAFQGQNFRLLQQDPVTGQYRCFGMSTNASINQSSNTDDATTKDVLGMASMPTVTSKSAQISVETLTITNAVELLKAIASGVPFTLIWDEVSTVNNQTPVGAAFARTVKAYLNDVTLNLNDRENTASSLQFASASPIAKITSTPTYEMVTPGTFIKGQFVRLFLGDDNTAAPSKVIAAAKTLALHVSVTVENATTKDTEGEWQIQEPTAISYDISTNALVRSGEPIRATVQGQALADIETIYEAGTPVKWKIANVSGQNNRTASSTIVSGSAVLTQLTINAANRQNATYDAQLTGYGEYTVAA